MRLREKVALLTFTFISTQTVWNHCMPRGYSNYPFIPETKSPIGNGNGKTTINQKFLINEALRESRDDAAVIRFSSVEYPFDSQNGEYYRFLNDYPIQLPSKDYSNNTSFQAPSYEREAKCKRKKNRVTNVKTTPDIKDSFTDYDSLPQPYCFRKCNFFPEVEYPLSSRDMWIPKYWSRLQDAKRNDKVYMGIISQSSEINTEFSDYGSNYANSPLSDLIKTLNTNKDLAIEMPTNNKNGDVDLGLSISGHQSEPVEATNAYSTNIPTESPIPINNEGTYDNFTSSASSRPMSSKVGKNTSSYIIETNSDTQDYIPELPIAEENMNVLDNLVQSLIGEVSSDDGESELSIPKNDSFDSIIKTLPDIKNGKLPISMPFVTEDQTEDNIVPITQIASITDTNSEVFPENDTLRTETNSNNVDIIESLIHKKEKESPDNIFTAMTTVINSDVRCEPTIPYKDLSDTKGMILPDTVFYNNINSAELPILKNDIEDYLISNTPSTGMGSTMVDVCTLRKDYTDNIRSTNSKNTDTDSELPIFKEMTNGSHTLYDIYTTTEGSNKKELFSPVLAGNTTNDMTCTSDYSISTTTLMKHCDLVPENILMSNKTSLDNIVKILPITDIGNIKSEPIDISKDSINDIVKTMINNEDHISKYSTADMFDSTKQTTPMFTSKFQISTNNIEITTKQNYNNITSAGFLPVFNTTSDSITTTPITRKETTGLATLPIISQLQCVDNIQLTTPMSSQYMTSSTSGLNTIPGDIISGKLEQNPFLIGDEDSINKDINYPNFDVQAKSDKLSESSTNLDNSDAAEYINDSLQVYDTGSTQDLTANGYEPVYNMLENNEETNSTANGSQDIMYGEYPNSTIQYEYIDDAEVSYTDVPYDFAQYEFPDVNDTWPVKANDSYLLHPPIVDYSDDISLLFCDINGTTLCGDII